MNMKKLLIAIAVSALFLTCKEEKKEPAAAEALAGKEEERIEQEIEKKRKAEKVIVKEQRRKELFKRLYSPLKSKKESVKAPKKPKPSPELIRVVPKKLTTRQKLWVRILIVGIILVLLAGVGTFWYWFFRVRSQTPVPSDEASEEEMLPGEQEEEEEEEEIPSEEIIISQALEVPLNVRQGPGADYSVIGVVYAGESYTLLEELEGWYKIEFEDGKEGWVSATYSYKATEDSL